MSDAELAAVAIRAQQLRAIAATIAVLCDLFTEFRPTIDGAIDAMRDLAASLAVHGTSEAPGSTWQRIMSKIDELTEENPEGEGK
jgi:hypothetical protein